MHAFIPSAQETVAGGSLSLRPLVYRASSRTEDMDGRGERHGTGKGTLSSRMEETGRSVTQPYGDEESSPSTDSPERDGPGTSTQFYSQQGHEHLSKGWVRAGTGAPVLQHYSQRTEPADVILALAQGGRGTATLSLL